VMLKYAEKFAIGIGLLANSFFLFPANAQQYTISPLVTITEAKGGQARGSITVINRGNEPLRMRVYAESFTYDRQKGFVFTAQDDRSAAPYLQFSPRELEIPPGVTRNIRVGIALPNNLPNREYRVAIFVEDLKENNVRANGSNNILSIKTRVAAVFFFSKGNSTVDVQARTAIWDATNKKISILLENQGTRSSYPNVIWRIEQNGKEIANDSLRGVIVQSQNSREVGLQTNGKPVSLASGEYIISGTIIAEGQKPTPFSVKIVVP
jgi:P pilus assembly chaperone PapD